MRRLGGPLALAMALIVLPWLFPDNYYVTVVLTTALLHAILAISLNLLMGYAGQISLGHAAFFGMGAYATAIMTSRFDWSPLAALLLGLAITGSIAFLIARPVLKLKGHYLAMATLGFGVIVSIVMVQAGDLTGGPDGMGDIAELSLFGWAVDSDLRWYAVISVVFVFIVVITANLIDSRTGRALRALHGSEIAAQMMGIDTPVAKTQVFVLSALIASLAGSLFAHQQSFITPDSFNFFFSVELVTMVVLGGLASTYGAVFGAVLLTFLPEWLVVFEDYEVMIYGAILMIVMIFLPQGVWVGVEQALSHWRRRGQAHV